MKNILFVFAILMFAPHLPAQTNEPVRLAVISESDTAAVAADVLTAQLSGNDKIHLLERNEIERIYHEQALVAGGRDEVKLGRILGADGLLLLNVVQTPLTTNLTTRLIAVKPGVAVATENPSWPPASLPDWATSFARHLELFLPKLTVLEKDAIPISIVNLRSALQSDEARETEQQVKLLSIQRLSQERQFFVLERQRMELLGQEKALKADESPFWNGAYLLDGVTDQNGYDKETITLNARLAPPKGGAPLAFEVSGSRTNLAELINQLAVKVNAALKVHSTVKEWNATDEAQQYFDEAKWALRWGVYAEAQMAADSAWALGKHDVDCASARVKSGLGEVSAATLAYDMTETSFAPELDANGKIILPRPDDSVVQSELKTMQAQHPVAMAYTMQEWKGGETFKYIYTDKEPSLVNIERATRALELYYDFSRNASQGVDSNAWLGADWYQLGIDDLVGASKVLQDFNFVRQSQAPVADKLAELRALARSVAALIAQAPSVHDSYYVGGRSVTHDELADAIGERPNIFSCKLRWGCLWQETPEDDIALYRELMASPVFCYIHSILWSHRLLTPIPAPYMGPIIEPPRLVAWNDEARRRIPVVWSDFAMELENSSNVLMQLEAKAIKFADVNDEAKLGEAFTNLLDAFVENRCALRTNNVEVLYLDWHVDDLVRENTANGIVTDVRTALEQRFRSEYLPKLAAKDAECGKLVSDHNHLREFEKEKEFLKDNAPFNSQTFVKMFLFGFKDYSKAQALEIQPLLAAYKSNLVALADNNNPRTRIGIMQVSQVEARVNRILNGHAPAPQPQAQSQAPRPLAVAKAATVAPASTNAPEIIARVLTVSKFLAIPLEGLPGDHISGVTINAHQWVEGRLLLDFKYDAIPYSVDTNGTWQSTSYPTYPAIAILDPKTEHWDVIGCPEVGVMTPRRFYHHSALWRGEVFTCDGTQIKKYDSKTRQWKVLEISDGGNDELFAVNGHLYGANKNTVFEIMDGGKSTRLLASTRRQPPMSALDTQELGTPTLFEGPGQSLRIATQNKILTWTGDDWRQEADTPPGSRPPAVFTDGVLFVTEEMIPLRQPGGSVRPVGHTRLSRLATDSKAVEICLDQQLRMPLSRPDAKTPHDAEPTWEMPANASLIGLPAASRQSDLYLLADHSETQDIIDNKEHVLLGKKVLAKGGCHAKLLCFSRDVPRSQTLFLKFDDLKGCPPVACGNSNLLGPSPVFSTIPPAWMLFAAGDLFFGLENPEFVFSPGSSSTEDIYKAGVWLMPVSQLEAAIAEQRQTDQSPADPGFVPNSTPTKAASQTKP
jgi:hypothetical protein